MKVLLAHNRYQQRGGEESVFENERALLEAAGVEVSTHEIHNDQIQTASARAAAFLKAAGNRAMAKTLVERATAGSFDLVHIHNFFPLLTPAAHIALAAAGVPVVQTLHNYRLLCANAMLMRDDRICELCVDKGRIHGLLHRCYRGSAAGTLGVIRMQGASLGSPKWLASVSRFIALTQFAREKFVAAGLPADKVVVKPNTIADPGTGIPGDLREGALFVGRIAPGKGIPTLLEAWRNLSRVKLTIVGDGPDLVRARAEAPVGVEFTGALPYEEVLNRMKRSAFLIMPSTWYEGFPVTLTEALACGLPVIASRIGGLPELLSEGENGFLCPPGDAAALARVVGQTFANSGRWPEWSAGARKTYELGFSQQRNTDQLLAIYGEAIAEQAAEGTHGSA